MCDVANTIEDAVFTNIVNDANFLIAIDELQMECENTFKTIQDRLLPSSSRKKNKILQQNIFTLEKCQRTPAGIKIQKKLKIIDSLNKNV